MNKLSEKRIALVTDYYEVGGGLEHIFQIAWGMSDFKFGIYATGGQYYQKFSELENVEIFNIGYNMEKIREFHPSIIHFHHLKPIFKCAVNPLRFNDTPILYTAHGIHIHKFEFMNGLNNRIKYFLRKNLEKYVYHFSDEVIAVSKEDLEYIGKHYQRDDCHLIPNGIDFRRINTSHLSRDMLRKRLGLPLKARLFLTVARFNFQKGYDILIEAIAKCNQHFLNNSIQFLFVGKGEELFRIQDLSKKLGISDKIRFLGTRNDVYDLMKACDYLILPSRWEGHPITLLEASYCELPIIASNTYGNREIISHGKNGILFQNTDAASLAARIMEVMNDRFCLEKLVKQAHKDVISFYQGSRMVDRLKEVYFSYL